MGKVTIDSYPIKACVNSGFCCTLTPCGFGKSGSDSNACIYLEFENGLSNCGIAEEIMKDPTSSFSPAFGAGCCANLFNERRKEIIIIMFSGEEQFVWEK